MTIYTQPNLTGGIDNAILDVVTEVPSLTPLLLLFVFLVVFIGGMIRQKRRLGTADVPMWATIASISTIMISLPLTLTTGLIQLEVLAIVVVITIFSGLWLFLSRNRNEI